MILFRLSLYITLLLLVGCATPLRDAQEQKLANMASNSQGSVHKKPHQDILDSGGQGPRLVLIPKGQFLMGSPIGESDAL